MWKSFFLAVGICLCILGTECLIVERAYLKTENHTDAETPVTQSLFQNGPGASSARREVVPPDWAPWSLMSAGPVVVLYSLTLPKRMAG